MKLRMLAAALSVIGVTAQDVGIVCLKAFNRGRYSALSVTGNGSIHSAVSHRTR